ncbi:hypothetical protein [Tautonia plasticadhaerens]|uniref:Uncharacterized protein n=1 Tax=Tautonia plasticadhaerens TaxID=2527974 RepID=A0A518HB54_9BACT|nr:hypothetical protein [Tautonia plasticadhaerens]QDV38092.1 hypothetical protein ElP_60410 [Tautonia plasticadhaerens]
MAPGRCRPFGVLDVMILVGSVSVGLGVIRAIFPEIRWDYFARELQSGDLSDAIVACMELWLILASPILLGLSAATVAIRLRRPRPSLRRALRSPGVQGCSWIVLGFASAIVLLLGWSTLAGPLLNRTVDVLAELPGLLGMALLVSLPASSFAIVAGWATASAFLPRRRACPGCWIDRLGLAVCGLWCLSSPLPIFFLLVMF